MYLVVDIERNILLWEFRDMFEAYRAADMYESKGIATIVRFDPISRKL